MANIRVGWDKRRRLAADVEIAGLSTFAGTVASGGTCGVCPTLSSLSSAHGNARASTAGSILVSCEFEVNSSGGVSWIRTLGNVVKNVSSSGYLSIGSTTGENPLKIINNLTGGEVVQWEISAN